MSSSLKRRGGGGNNNGANGGGGKEKKPRERKERPIDLSPDIEFFTNFTLEFVKENDKNYYFVIKSLGQEKFIFYKAKAVALMNALQQALMICDKNVADIEHDRELFEKKIDEDLDNGFQSRLLASVYFKKIGIALRVFVMNDEIGDFVPSKRAIKFEHDRDEFEKMSAFIDRKLLHVNEKKK